VREHFDKKGNFHNVSQVDHFIIDFKPLKVYDLLRRYRMLNSFMKNYKEEKRDKKKNIIGDSR